MLVAGEVVDRHGPFGGGLMHEILADPRVLPGSRLSAGEIVLLSAASLDEAPPPSR